MNWGSWLFWGFVSTLLLTTTLGGLQGLGLTRMNLPYTLGLMVTGDRDRARLYGFFFQLANGWGFSLLYVLMFESWGVASWWRGLVIGVLHALLCWSLLCRSCPASIRAWPMSSMGPRRTGNLSPLDFWR